VPAFIPEPFASPAISPDTATLFRRTPYISPSEYKQTPTAVGVGNLVPGGNAAEQLAALAAVISRASDWVDTFCFHNADGTLAASPSSESGWVRVKSDGSLKLICNYKPVLEVDALALGSGPNSMTNIGQEAAEELTITGQIIQLAQANPVRGVTTVFPGARTVYGKVYAVWVYVNGFPHTSIAKEAKVGAKAIEVAPSVPGGSVVYGVYPGTQLTIHDGELTESVVVSSVSGLTLNTNALLYTHKPPAAPDTTRVSAVPWVVEQATISYVSSLIKMRGSRAMVIPQSPAKSASAPKQAEGQAGGMQDRQEAERMLKPFVVPYLRST